MSVRNFVASCLLALFVVVQALALDESADRQVSAVAPVPVAIVLSGGVSLGAYQAGFLAYAAEYFRANKDLFAPRLLTGASAGGLNAFLATLAFCSERSARLSDELLYSSWIDLRLADFKDASLADPRSILSNAGLDRAAERARAAWEKGLPSSCDLVLGLTATRAKPVELTFPGGLAVRRQSERFALRIRGRGEGKPPRLTNYPLLGSGLGEAVLALPEAGSERGHERKRADGSFAALRQLLGATSAFPAAFPPQSLRFCVSKPEDPRWLHAGEAPNCRASEVEQAEFVDGGALDNKPLGLAERLERAGLAPSREGGRWRETPLFGAAEFSQQTLFIYVDLASSSLPSSPGLAEAPAGFARFIGDFASDFASASRDKDLLSVLERRPGFARQIAASRNDYPRAGEPLLGFFGFFDRGFREFDFFLGMLEARTLLVERLGKSLRRGQEPIGARAKAVDANGLPGWSPFVCLAAWLEGGDSAACAQMPDDQRERMLAVARVSIARLASGCEAARLADAGPLPRPISDDGCARLAIAQTRGGPAFARAAERQRINESDFSFQLRLLALERYPLPEAGIGRGRALDAGAAMKADAIGQFGRLADRQPSGADAFALRAAAPALLELYEPMPSERIFRASLGGAQEIAASWLGRANWLSESSLRGRYVAVARFDGLERILSSWSRSPAAAALAGLEWESKESPSSIWRFRAGFSLGWRFQLDGEARSRGLCARGDGSPFDCEGLVVEPTASATALDRLFFSSSLETMPFSGAGGAKPIRLLVQSGLQFFF